MVLLFSRVVYVIFVKSNVSLHISYSLPIRGIWRLSLIFFQFQLPPQQILIVELKS
jgi:hypothetical protein